MTRRRLIRSTGIISLATGISRVLGFVRDIVIANFFGTALYAQAFVVAFRIPNLLRDLIGDGAANAALVPVLTEELTKKGKTDFFKLAQVAFNILFWILVAITLIGIVAAPLIVKLIAPGFSGDPEKFALTVTLTRILFPFLILVGIWAYAMGVLNSLGHFAAPAFGPCLMNLSMIACATYFGENVFGLTSGVLMGGLVQLLLQFPPLYRRGWTFRLTNEFKHPKAERIGILLVPRALGACVYQINVFVSTILASLSGIVGDGAVAAMYYANRVWQLPLALFGIALAQAALPAMSRHVALNDKEKLKDMLSFSLNILSVILIPSTIGLMVLAKPITRVLFERGVFTSYSTLITSEALFFYAIGLVASGGIKILVNAFYSMQDTMTPVKTAGASLVINLVLNVTLMWPLKVGGLALATSVASIFNFVALYIMLRKKIGDFGMRSIIDTFLRVTIASAIMGAFLYIYLYSMPKFTLIHLIISMALGVVLYLVASYVLRVKEMTEIVAWISKKR